MIYSNTILKTNFKVLFLYLNILVSATSPHYTFEKNIELCMLHQTQNFF